jgi:outer membrane protein assembly factor BamB
MRGPAGRTRTSARRPRNVSMLTICVAAAMAAGISCGGGQTRLNLFSTDWTDDSGASIARVYERVGHAPAPPSADVAIAVVGNAGRIIGLRLSDGGAAPGKWSFTHSLDGRPVVAGNVVVASGGGEVFALDAATGKPVWRRPTGGLPLLGAGDDGTVTVVAFRSAGGVGSVLLAVARDGQIVRQIETPKALGTPAVLGHLAFVPWAGQYVSVIDPANGDEAARVTLRQETSRAWTQSGALWFGENGFVRFDERIRDASKGKASTVMVPTRELPGMPRVAPPGDEPMPAAANALDKTREYAKPMATDAGAALEDGRWYGTYFRLAMGFDAEHERLTWVHMQDADIVGGAAAAGGLVLCDEHGKIAELDAKTGTVVATLDLGEPVESCIVNVDAFRITGPAAAAKPLAAQLADAVRADEPQLVIAQKLLLRELAAAEDEVATSALVDAASDPRTSPDLLPAARDALANRRNGAAAMEAALARHYDFLKDVLRSPPVGPIADALGAMKDKAAVPLLVGHLFDPADTDNDVKRAAAAVAVLAEADVAPALRQFFGMYRATAANDDISAAVVSTAEALVGMNDTPGIAQVEAAQANAATVPYARERLGAVLASRPTPPPAPEPKK